MNRATFSTVAPYFNLLCQGSKVKGNFFKKGSYLFPKKNLFVRVCAGMGICNL